MGEYKCASTKFPGKRVTFLSTSTSSTRAWTNASLFFFKSREAVYLWKTFPALKITTIKVAHLPFRPRDGQTIPPTEHSHRHGETGPGNLIFFNRLFFSSPGLNPSCLRPGRLVLRSLSLTQMPTKPVCKQEAAEVGGCETRKPEDSSENASVEKEPDLATPLGFRVLTEPVHPP